MESFNKYENLKSSDKVSQRELKRRKVRAPILDKSDWS